MITWLAVSASTPPGVLDLTVRNSGYTVAVADPRLDLSAHVVHTPVADVVLDELLAAAGSVRPWGEQVSITWEPAARQFSPRIRMYYDQSLPTWGDDGAEEEGDITITCWYVFQHWTCSVQ